MQPPSMVNDEDGRFPIQIVDDKQPPSMVNDEDGRFSIQINDDKQVLQALRRLKGSSNRKEKMSADTKLVFDQLTEDAMKLMEDSDYNVYDEKQEVFQREAGHGY